MEGNDEMTKDETIHALEADVHELRQQLAAANKEHDELQLRYYDLEAENRHLKGRVDADDRELQRQIDDTVEHWRKVMAHNESLQDRLAAAEGEIEKLKADLADNRQMLNELGY